MAEYTSSIELKAQTGQLDRKLKKVTKDLRGIDAQVQKTQGKFTKMTTKVGKGFDKLNKKLKENKAQLAGLSVAIGAIALKGVADFKKFEDGITQIATLGVKDLKQVEKQLNKIRKEFGITGAEATKGYYDIISAGAKTGADAMKQLEAATKLAAAGNTDLAGAVDIVTSGINVWAKAGISAEQVTDKLFLAVKFGKTTVEELGQTFGMVAPIVQTAGGSMDDYAAAMATITAGGIKTRQATTGLSSIMSNMIKVTPKAAKEAERLGLAWGTGGIEANGFVGTLENLKNALAKDSSAGTIADKLGRLFDSKESIGAVSVLLENFEKFKDINKEMASAAGTTATAMELVKQTASFNFAKFNQQLSIMSQNIGAAIVPGLLDMANAFGPVVDFMAAMIAQHPGIVKVTLAVTALATSIAFLGGPATLAIAGIGTVFVKVMNHFQAFEKGGVVAFERLTLTWSNFWAGLKRMSISQIFKAMLDGSVKWITQMVTKIKTKITELTKWFVDPVKKAAEKVEYWFWWVYNEVVGNSHIPDMVDKIKTEIAQLWDWFVTPVKNMTAAVSSYFEDLDTEGLTPAEKVKTVWEDLTEAISNGWDGATKAVKEYYTAASNGGNDNREAAISGNESDFARNIASLGIMGSLIRAATAGTLAWEEAMVSLGVAQAEPLAGFKEMKGMKFGSLRRELQKTLQRTRILNAAMSDDIGSKSSTDGKVTARAMEDASKTEQRIRKEQIAKARTAGQEMNKIRLAQNDAYLAKLAAQAEARGMKIERGFFSRMLFGNGTALTWTAKLNGMMGQIGKAFDALSGKFIRMGMKLDAVLTRSAGAQKTIIDERVKKAEMDVKSARNANTRAIVGERLAGDFDKDGKPKDGTKPSKNISKTQRELLKAEQKLEKLLKQQKGLIEKMNTGAKSSNTSMGTIAKGFSKLSKVLGSFGGIFRVVTEQSAKVAQSGATLGAKVAGSKAVAAAGSAASKFSSVTGITKTMKIFSAIARKVLIPIFAVVDAFKGWTVTEELQKNLGTDKTEFSTAEKVISATSEAIGNFFNGFLDLGGIVLEWFGADAMAEYMKGIDLAPEVAKVFQTFKNIFETITNVFKAIFGGDEGDDEESAFTTVIKKVGELLSDLLSVFVTISEALASVTSGEITLSQAALDIGTAVGGFFLDVAQALIDGLVAGVKGIGNWGLDLMKDMTSKIVDGIRGWLPSWLGGTGEGEAPSDVKPKVQKYKGGVNNPNHPDYVKAATGGFISGAGTGTSDSIPAMLSNGEYVINAKQTAKYRSLLQAINGGRPLPGFKDGGEVGRNYQFLQFAKGNSPHGEVKGGVDSFDLDRTMTLFVNNLDRTNPKVREVTEMMDFLKDKSSNLTEEQILQHDYTKRINKALYDLRVESMDLAEVSAETAGSINDVNEAAKEAASTWSGMGETFTSPIKQAFLEGGSIADGIKMGMHNLFGNIASKFLDRAFKPMEEAIDNMLFSMDNSIAKSMSSGGGAAGGGFLSSIGSFLGFSEGGMVPQYLATGGVAMGGPKGTDTVPAWLTPGEVVLNAGQQKNVANAMSGANGGAVYNTYNLEISGNVDQRAIDQIKNVIASSPNEVNNAANTGKRNASGIRRTR